MVVVLVVVDSQLGLYMLLFCDVSVFTEIDSVSVAG